MRFEINDEQLWWDNQPLGPASALFADAGEKLVGPGAISDVQTPHRIDYLMTVGGKVVGVESKTINDLISSWVRGRLQRQLRVLYETVDIPVLMLRGVGTARSFKLIEKHPNLMEDLLKFQLLATETSQGLIYLAPAASAYYSLVNLKENLLGNRKLSTVVTRYEAKQKPKGGSPREKILQSTIRGCGPTMAKKLAKIGSLKDILSATPTQLRNAGANKTVLASIKGLKK
jgi:ERCC4-type nuclease